jgi:hypothetical protein
MLKSMFATGALLAAAASVSHVDFSASGVSVAGRAVTEDTLQLREAGDGSVLASRNKVESLGGLVEVALGNGRVLTMEPGVQLARSGDAWQISSHGRHPLRLASADAAVSVASPVSVTPVDGGWLLADGSRIEGNGLQASLVTADDVVQVAAGEVPPDGPEDELLLTPRQRREKRKEAKAAKLDTRRIFAEDFQPGAEAADEKALRRVFDVSPSGF